MSVTESKAELGALKLDRIFDHTFDLPAERMAREGQRPGNMPAQGIALGHRKTADKALKGPDKKWDRPFRALIVLCSDTQGAALGWHVGAPLVLDAGLDASDGGLDGQDAGLEMSEAGFNVSDADLDASSLSVGAVSRSTEEAAV